MADDKANNTVRKVGRPRADIDKRQFEKLCGLQCTVAEICAFFDITDKTLYRWCRDTYGRNFSAVFREKREIGKISLRRSQWKLAEKNATMAIFLGKNYLDQNDAQKVEVSGIDTEKSKLDELLKQRRRQNETEPEV